ncbi:acyltransferase domain-containing protein, partial [Frankia sp. AgKG'84/4]|uniref:acyltransferase domain-containing protein n=1 Tax=Frankia sp. AgKG'84/4 TaxID=573490 RepID=UPI00202A4C82
LGAALAALAAGRPAPGISQGHTAPGTRTRIALLFTGQGSQRPGMGRDLYRAYPGFAADIDEISERFDAHLDRPLREVMFAAPATPDAALLDQTRYTQPALFAYGTALYRLITSWGVTPALLAGHSIGELTAAHVAGIWSLADAVTLVAARGRLMQACPPGGAMIAIRAGAAQVEASLAPTRGRVVIAAVNGPAAVVIAGDAEAAEQVAADWAARGHRTRRLPVSHAFHSPHLDGMLTEFRRIAAGITYQRPAIPVVSTLTGAAPDPAALRDPDHWMRQARGAVLFLDAARRLHAEGTEVFVELGPDAILTALLPECLPTPAPTPGAGAGEPAGRGGQVVAFASARAGRPEADTLLTALAGLDVHGVPVDWRAVLGRRARLVDLPTYPFQRRRHWLDPPATPTPTPTATAAPPASVTSVPARGSAPAPVGAPESDGTAVAPARARAGNGDGWRHRVAWRPLADGDATAAITAQAGASATLGGRWAVLVPPTGAAPALVSRLSWIIERLGGTATPIVLDRADRDAVAGRLADGLLGGNAPVGGLVSLLALDDTPHPDHPVLTTGLALTVTLAQAQADLRLDTPLWLLTRGAVAAEDGDRVTRPDQAMTWGLGRTLALESPHAWGGLIDLPAERTGGAQRAGGSVPDDQSLLWLGVALTGVGGEDQFAARPRGLRVPRLLPVDPPDPAEPTAAPWRPTGTVLITGGTGAVGAHLARHLARLGARRLVRAGGAGGCGWVRDLTPVV